MRRDQADGDGAEQGGEGALGQGVGRELADPAPDRAADEVDREDVADEAEHHRDQDDRGGGEDADDAQDRQDRGADQRREGQEADPEGAERAVAGEVAQALDAGGRDGGGERRERRRA